MSISPSPLTEAILGQVIASLSTRRPQNQFEAQDVLDAADLRQLGLDSLGLVNLMMAVEDSFDLMIPQDAMKPQNFRSVAAIEALVTQLRIAA